MFEQLMTVHMKIGLATGLVIASIVFLWHQISHWMDKQLTEQLRQRNVQYHPHQTLFSLLINRKRFELLNDEGVQRFGPVFGFKSLGSITIMIAEPELIQLILSKQFSHFTDRRRVNSQDKLFSLQLTSVEGEHWKRLRAIVSQAFATGKLRRIKPILDDICQTMVNSLERSLDQNCLPDGQTEQTNKNSIVDMKCFAGNFTLDAIIQVAFGVRLDLTNDNQNPVLINARSLINNDMSLKVILQFLMIFMAPEFISKLFKNFLRFRPEEMDFLKNFSCKLIDEKRRQFIGTGISNTNNKSATNFIEFMLEAEQEFKLKQQQTDKSTDQSHSSLKYMTTDEMIAQCLLFLFAGYDTTSTTISMSCYYMALNPNAQQLAYEEICNILEKNGTKLKSIPFEVYQTEFTFITAVIQETLRLTPPGAAIERRCVNDCTLATSDGRYRINVKRDDIIRIPVWSMHYNEKYFPKPEQFCPERFIEMGNENENGTKSATNIFHSTNHAYLPFGAGPRACIAKSLALLEARMALVWLIKHYKFTRCSQTNVPMKFHNQTLMTPCNVFLSIEPRSN